MFKRNTSLTYNTTCNTLRVAYYMSYSSRILFSTQRVGQPCSAGLNGFERAGRALERGVLLRHVAGGDHPLRPFAVRPAQALPLARKLDHGQPGGREPIRGRRQQGRQQGRQRGTNQEGRRQGGPIAQVRDANHRDSL
eukprot:8386406-Pyramimonas_sp.AAC.2